MAESSRFAGRLVVATPALGDLNFAHSVVLVLEHNDDGALGVTLNRPSEIAVSSALPAWHDVVVPPERVFVGGPVQPEAMLGLARAEASGTALQPVAPGLAVVDLSVDPAALAAHVGAVRIFVGYAGWAPGQLEDEVAAGGWFVVDPLPDDPFDTDPAALWRTVLHRQGGLLKTISENPSLN